MPIAVASLVVVLLSSSLVAASEPPPTPRLVAYWGQKGSAPGSFDAVMGIAVAPDGSVYVADPGRIEKFSADGEFLLEWGTRGSGDGQFTTPTGIAVGPSGEVYVVEYGGNRVQVFDADGRFLRKWGSLGVEQGQFHGPSGIAVDRKGDVYVADTDNFRVQKFSSSGEFRTSWGSRGNGAGEFGRPLDIAVSPDGKVYVPDFAVGSIQVFSLDGQFLVRWGEAKGEVPEPRSIIRSGRGMLKAGKGEFGTAGPSRPVMESPLDRPGKIAVDSKGVLYVLNRAGNRAERYAPDGSYINGWWVADDDVPWVEQATEIAVAASGDIYVGELNGPRVRKFGYGPIRTEQVVSEILGPERLRSLDALIALPLGAPKSRGSVSAPADIRLEWSFTGFDTEPTLQSATLEMDVSGTLRLESVRAAIVDTVGRRLGAAPGPLDLPTATPEPTTGENAGRRLSEVPGRLDSPTGTAEPTIRENAGVRIATQVAQRVDGGNRIVLERESTRVRMATSNADACDLRILEGGLTEPTGQWEVLLRGLRTSRPDLAAELVLGQVTPESLFQEVRRASDPAVSDSDRDLVQLAADQWLRFSTTGKFESPARRLDDAWGALGFHNATRPRASGDYCGSILETLAAGAGRNEWADRAFLLLLDQGSEVHCYGDYYGEDYGQSLYVPVLKHGEAFLAANQGAALWPSVALRVALAHETAVALSSLDWLDDPDLEAQAAEHRRRALELYRALTSRTQNARLRHAIDERVRDLASGAAAKCRVYWIEGEC